MSAAVAAAAAAALSDRRSLSRSSISVQNSNQYNYHLYHSLSVSELSTPPTLSRYESQKRRDWNYFLKYLKNKNHPPLKLTCCTGADVVEFLRCLNQAKVEASPCSLQGYLDGVIGRLRVAFEENRGRQEMNPFCSRVVAMYLEEVKKTSKP